VLRPLQERYGLCQVSAMQLRMPARANHACEGASSLPRVVSSCDTDRDSTWGLLAHQCACTYVLARVASALLVAGYSPQLPCHTSISCPDIHPPATSRSNASTSCPVRYISSPSATHTVGSEGSNPAACSLWDHPGEHRSASKAVQDSALQGSTSCRASCNCFQCSSQWLPTLAKKITLVYECLAQCGSRLAPAG